MHNSNNYLLVTAYLPGIGCDIHTSFYLQAHNMVRGITGYDVGNGPFISIHNDFHGQASSPAWTGAKRLTDRAKHKLLGSKWDMAEAGVQLLWAPSLNTR
ncbi:hypothetical protein B0H17DRAFT_1200004 [Mycena rosella]|uniref:Uncharacterized protein n=1 Tax=Mycena rosella TaxID=1033263 RepID=A0AAD7GKF0_MYCRO|nr:hypothetical protein B0H17DRAFT_1200004 [Mycena rosella]